MWRRTMGNSLLYRRFSTMARMFKHVAKTFGHHYTVHRGVVIPMLCGSYWSAVRTWRHSRTTTALPCMQWRTMGNLLLCGRFSIMARMFKHVAKTFGHRYTVHRGVGI